MTTRAELASEPLNFAGVWLWGTALTIFLGAFLLFQIELLMAKMILPWFGGSAAVWIACLMFFQVALLGGYAYAHIVATWLAAAPRTYLHIALLLVSLASLPIIPSESWKPAGDANPLPIILALLSATVGLPFLLLSSATPLLQSWIAQSSNMRPLSIYRLYALSNLGSMLALLSYPLVVEPALPVSQQAWSWSYGYMAFALLYATIAWHSRAATQADQATGAIAPTSRTTLALWFLLPLAGSTLLLAVTNHALRNVAPIPLFWMVPLALYLLSFILCFEYPRLYWRPLWLALFTIAAALMSFALTRTIVIGVMLFFWLITLFICCMVFHGELARLRPEKRKLTSYYLTIAAGGAAGGILVSVIAPIVLPLDFDLAIAIPGSILLVGWALTRDRDAIDGSRLRWIASRVAAVLLLAATADMLSREYDQKSQAIYFERNFYGPLRVEDKGSLRVLINGTINHGAQYLTFGSEEPISYYARTSGIGLALGSLGQKGPLKVGAVGLGAGTIAAYARPEDTFRFFEINPAVPDIARRFFTYLKHCGEACQVVLGDARLSLERAEPQQFDLLAVDAFNSDSIPVHLLTREAFDLYWRHIKPGGILAIHTTNSYVNLVPIVAQAAAEAGKIARVYIEYPRGEAVQTTQWVLVATPDVFAQPALSNGGRLGVPPDLRPWTDDYSNVWRVMR